jgi:hypothetical protein
LTVSTEISAIWLVLSAQCIPPAAPSITQKS